MTTLWLIRHGEAHVNQPLSDGSYSLIDRDGLTERGLEQARLLGERLAGEQVAPDAVVASSFPRARQTAEVVCASLGVDLVLDDDVQEWRPGERREHVTSAEAELTWQRILDGHDHDLRVADAETHNEFQTRVDGALRRIAEDHADRLVLVITHGGIVSRSFVTFLGLPPRQSLVGLHTRHTSITEWRHFDAPGAPRWVLRRYNDATHLPD